MPIIGAIDLLLSRRRYGNQLGGCRCARSALRESIAIPSLTSLALIEDFFVTKAGLLFKTLVKPGVKPAITPAFETSIPDASFARLDGFNQD